MVNLQVSEMKMHIEVREVRAQVDGETNYRAVAGRN